MNYTDTRQSLVTATEHLEELQRALQHANALAWTVRCSHMPGDESRVIADEFLARFDHLTNSPTEAAC
jgi:hypothetical protein